LPIRLYFTTKEKNLKTFRKIEELKLIKKKIEEKRDEEIRKKYENYAEEGPNNEHVEEIVGAINEMKKAQEAYSKKLNAFIGGLDEVQHNMLEINNLLPPKELNPFKPSFQTRQFFFYNSVRIAHSSIFHNEGKRFKNDEELAEFLNKKKEEYKKKEEKERQEREEEEIRIEEEEYKERIKREEEGKEAKRGRKKINKYANELKKEEKEEKRKIEEREREEEEEEMQRLRKWDKLIGNKKKKEEEEEEEHSESSNMSWKRKKDFDYNYFI
jgi:hypothetical protein